MDPRIKRIKQQEKEAREAKKRGAVKGGPVKKTKAEEEAEKKRLEEEAAQKELAEQVRLHTRHRYRTCLSDLSYPFPHNRLLAPRQRRPKLPLPMLPRRLVVLLASRRGLKYAQPLQLRTTNAFATSFWIS